MSDVIPMTDTAFIRRPRAKRLCVINHKGGVGKTSLTVNIAAEIARRGKRVLLIDSDPQCSLTSYLFNEATVDDLLDSSDDEEQGNTVWSALKPLTTGEGWIRLVDPIEYRTGKIWVLPGDIQLSGYEKDLDEYWTNALRRKQRGYKGVTALSAVVSALCEVNSIDYVFYDSGPNIGPLNRSIVLDCDYFVVAVGLDPLSVRALSTLGSTLVTWITEWRTVMSLAPEDVYLLPGEPRSVGYVAHRFRTYGGIPSSDFRSMLPIIEKEFISEIAGNLKDIDPDLIAYRGNPNLGNIPDFGSIAVKALKARVPLGEVQGLPADKQNQIRTAFDGVTKKLLSRVG